MKYVVSVETSSHLCPVPSRRVAVTARASLVTSSQVKRPLSRPDLFVMSIISGGMVCPTVPSVIGVDGERQDTGPECTYCIVCMYIL